MLPTRGRPEMRRPTTPPCVRAADSNARDLGPVRRSGPVYDKKVYRQEPPSALDGFPPISENGDGRDVAVARVTSRLSPCSWETSGGGWRCRRRSRTGR